MAQAHLYHKFFNSLAAKDVNINSDTFKMMLLNSSYVPNIGTHQFQSSLTNELPSGNGYVTGGGIISGVATGLISTNDVQTITPPGSGTYTITLIIGGNSQTTTALPFNASATTIRAALQALPNVGAGNVTVTGTGPYIVTFGGSLGAQLITLMTTSAGSVSHSTPGAGSWNISGGNVSWTSATFTSPNAARFGAIVDTTPGSAGANPIVGLVDFITDQSPANSTLSVTWDPTGIAVVQIV